MPEERGTGESGHKVAGRLYAALSVLHVVAASGRRLPGAERFTGKDSPQGRIQGLRSDPYDDLLRAHGRPGDHGKAAAEAFRAIPGLLPPRSALHDTISAKELDQFTAGYETQLAEYRKSYGSLLPD
ncbi:hypothetical protein [Streptomyces sp. NPDC005209]|uniref:hypothetical protein n=1 Tax=Streptomyces sp. NPDC005209 TaxID=3156715 RepID=UPI0033A48EA3